MKKNSANQISATNYRPVPAGIMGIFEEARRQGGKDGDRRSEIGGQRSEVRDRRSDPQTRLPLQGTSGQITRIRRKGKVSKNDTSRDFGRT